MPLLNLSEGIRGRESLTTGKPSIGLSRGIMSGRPRILAPSIRPFGSTQDRRWISKKARASPASAFSYERYALCSLGVQRLLRYPGLTTETTKTPMCGIFKKFNVLNHKSRPDTDWLNAQ